MRMVKPLSIYSLLSCLSFGAFIFHLWFNTDRGSGSDAHTRSEPTWRYDVNYDQAIRNSTLGFEKIFVLNLPSRGDRLDAFVLSSSLTGFEAEVMPGIDGATVPNTSLPTTEGLPNDERGRNGAVGTWRAHLNIARKIVESRLSSALIMEDDSDWDVTLKDRLADFAAGVRYFQQTGDKPAHSPYGDGWDMLWPGHCALHEHKTPVPRYRYLIENDPTVPIPHRRVNFDHVIDINSYDDTTRVVFPVSYGICLYAYALSYAGAQKVLRAQAVRKNWAHVDHALGQMCNETVNGFRCIGIFPQIVDSHKTAGTWDRDSNIGVFSHDAVREKASTANIVYSTRNNVDRIMMGQQAEHQWPEDGGEAQLDGPIRIEVIEAPPTPDES